MSGHEKDWALETLGIRIGHDRTGEGEHSEPIFATSSFVFGSAAEAAARFSGDSEGNIYSRFTNPTVRAFEQRLAAMEGGESLRGDGFRYVGNPVYLHGAAAAGRPHRQLAQHLRQYHDVVQ